VHLVGFYYKNVVVVGVGHRTLQHVGLFGLCFIQFCLQRRFDEEESERK